MIIASAMSNFPTMPPRVPSKLPQPARPAAIIFFPAMISPAIAPMTGPTNKPITQEKSDDRADDSRQAFPTGSRQIFRARVTAGKIESRKKQGEENQHRNCHPADAFRRAEHDAMKDGGGEDDRCPGKYGQHCSDQSDRHQHESRSTTRAVPSVLYRNADRVAKNAFWTTVRDSPIFDHVHPFLY